MNCCDVSNGVIQSGVLSPLLFIVYIDELLLCLKMSSLGCHVGHYYTGAFGYADNVILLAPTFSTLNGTMELVISDIHIGNVIGDCSQFDKIDRVIGDFITRFNMISVHF